MTDAEEREWQTRKARIDPRLRSWGWAVVPFDPAADPATLTNHAVEEYQSDNGPADYAFFVDGRILGILEAKRLSLGPQEVLTQAERYARGIQQSAFNFDGMGVPFLYSTNGEIIWHHDVRHHLSRSRKIADFHTPNALRQKLDHDPMAKCGWFSDHPNDHPRLRPYQIEANTATEQAIAARKRQMLLAMATGTGKTFTMANQVYRLMKSGVAKRVLFLVDRRALAAQAVREFAGFEPEPGLKFDKIYEVYSNRFQQEDFGDEDKFDPKVIPNQYLTDPQPGHAFVYVCTIQRMAMNLFGRQAVFADSDEEPDADADRLAIPIHAFDVIVADECHRGYTSQELSTWRNTLEHFDALKIGLTATPAAHTTTYFKEVVFRYPYERAVREGYLVDYDAVKISSEVRMKGVFLDEGEQVSLVDTTTGQEQLDLLEDEREFDTTEIEQKVTAPDSNRKILEEIKKYAVQHEQECGRLPKTLIFAVNDLRHTSHADQLVDLARDIFGRGDSFVQKITGKADRPLQRIREFRNRPNPGIVVSVDMMSTGVDIPALEFVVLLRPVKSRILWEQMLGRGTRLCPDINKSHFVVFDCFDGTLFEYFKNASAFTSEPPVKPTLTNQEIIEDIWNNRDRAYNIRCLVKRLQRINKQMSGEGRERFTRFIEEGDVATFATELPRRLQDDFAGTMKLLRNPDFQDLMVNYPRAERTFIVAHQTEDMVESEWLIRDGAGNEYKAEDYLAEFSGFVTENPEQIDAIGILLARPQDWSTDALAELRQKLAASRQRFTVENLQKAHAAHYKKSLVEIISMVKHAAKKEEPLLTAEERVDRAVDKITTDQEFTEEQRRWLALIREHLIRNLSIDQEDFESVPIFTRQGAWAKANNVFDGDLAELLERINEAIAA